MITAVLKFRYYDKDGEIVVIYAERKRDSR